MHTPPFLSLTSGRRALLALMTGCATVSTPVSVADTLANTP